MPTYDPSHTARLADEMRSRGFDDVADALEAATQEVERLTRELDEAARNALAETIVSVKHEREANDAIALVAGERDAAHAEIERLRGLVGETTYVAERTGALTDSDRQDLAAIRHDAGVEGGGR